MHKIASDILVGTDIELFLFDNKLGEIVPSVGVLPGTKENPYRPPSMEKGFAIQEDNVMVEFNIPPAGTYTKFGTNIKEGLVMVLTRLEKQYGSQYSLFTSSHTHKFAPKYLKSNQAQLIGCEPDFDAYNGGAMRNEAPVPSDIRTCGGHIHLGGDFQCPDFVAALFAELFFSIRCRMTVKAGDARAAWYGKPGVFRPKPYGIEYRTPNNQWAWKADGRIQVADVALRLARWLTDTAPLDIQTAFRKIPWVTLRQYMLIPLSESRSRDMRNKLLTIATDIGVPI